MENRSGLCTDLAITESCTAEPLVAEALLKKLRRMKIRPHIARIENRKTDGLDGRTTRHESYRVSQRKRQGIEENFGWLKTVGGLRKSRFVGIKRTQLYAYLAAAEDAKSPSPDDLILMRDIDEDLVSAASASPS
jgi:hypothetical protein